MWQSLRPKVTALVMWSVKSHWLFLVFLVGFQYFSGKAMNAGWWFWGLSPAQILRWHNLNGTIILVAMVAMAAEKVFLILMRRGKI